MHAYLFPGQGTQFSGMGKDLYDSNRYAKELFEKANDTLGFRITDIMFEGTQEELQQTQVTQPAIFLHSVILSMTHPDFRPTMVAGHSLGELSALVAIQVLSFEAGIQLVAQRAQAMQVACAQAPGAMAAVLGLDDEIIEEVCATLDVFVVPANYNCPGQLVIAGTPQGIDIACEALQRLGAQQTILLPVSGAFHSNLMAPAQQQLVETVEQTTFRQGICPIYQNVCATPTTIPSVIQKNLLEQLTAPVRWTQTIRRMVQDGARHFTICGPGKVLQGLLKRIDRGVPITSLAVHVS